MSAADLKKPTAEQKQAAKDFAARWQDRGYEKGETQSYWTELLGKVLGVEQPTQYMDFELPVQIDGCTKFVDAYIPETSVLIEQKSAKVNLRHAHRQSDGSELTPYQQARRYGGYLPYNRRPRWIVVSNFQEIRIHDMNRPNDEPEVIQLAQLPQELYRLRFLTAERDEHIRKETKISVEAGEIVAGIHRELRKQYKNPDDPQSLESLNVLCVRLVFCLYAEDAGIFEKNQFGDYLRQTQTKDIRKALMDLFEVLDQKEEDRDPYLTPELAAFPYVNGGLFARRDIEIPLFTNFIRSLIIDSASDGFDWSEISPTIFGAIFETTLDPDKRRAGGMHYTSIENIHKVIDPLFLDALNDEFADILEVKYRKTWDQKLKAFQKKLGSLTFLDPACGSGNFLTETYLSLRRLENAVKPTLFILRIAIALLFNNLSCGFFQFRLQLLDRFAPAAIPPYPVIMNMRIIAQDLFSASSDHVAACSGQSAEPTQTAMRACQNVHYEPAKKQTILLFIEQQLKHGKECRQALLCGRMFEIDDH
ncbi:MAG: SAM-dependent DNA methyltransferase [Clostridia bacterium]|nr:SAM-dependent DNA methyltransferase [Clostridia bacterium]